MIIITNKVGQLGNRLFVFAHFIACASEHNLTVINPAFEEYACFFQSTYHNIFSQFPVEKSSLKIELNRLIRVGIYKTTSLLARFLLKANIKNSSVEVVKLEDEQKLDLSSFEFLSLTHAKKIIFVHGWLFRDELNFAKHADVIRAYFTPVEPHQANIASLISQLRQSCSLLVGVHMRQGDYASFEGGKYFFTTDDYIQLMKNVEHLFPEQRVAFLICSNAPQDALAFSGFNFRFGNNHLIEDMYSLAQCDYLMGPPSTYTMWASFYGKVPLYGIENASAAISLSSFHAYLPNP